MGVILQVALPSRVLAAARLQCGAAGAGASRGLGVCAEHARLAARGESARAMEIGDFLVGFGPGGNSQCVMGTIKCSVFRAIARKGEHSLPINFGSDALGGFPLATNPSVVFKVTRD